MTKDQWRTALFDAVAQADRGDTRHLEVILMLLVDTQEIVARCRENGVLPLVGDTDG